MFLILRLFFNFFYENFISDKGIDPRVVHYQLVATPWRMLSIIAVYLLFVLKYGPEWMKNRKPFDLKNVICVYNACQVVLNFTVAAGLLYSICTSKNFRFTCHELTTGNTDPALMLTIKFCYLFYITKFLDLLDTVFFTLRKKGNQTSFLHVYHHTGMIAYGYYGFRYYVASHATVGLILNAVVHVIMYSYYLITSLNPNFKNQLWWKKRITLLQIIQFFLGSMHFTLPFFAKDCNFPKRLGLIVMTQTSFLVVMFSDFYYRSYIKTKKVVSPVKDDLNNIKYNQNEPTRPIVIRG